ncbi:nucleolar protein [Cyclospora cayetanensis]|uniref:Nucleolar protein 56 n=1 Tax=Cyclospora cayetanensis TaxID=88456 RepID=A0A1D3DAS2_9EIME|nr:nucleolar protein [Cyclospora cayetanensis]
MSGETFLLFESAPGLLLLRVKQWDAVAQDTEAVQEACADAQRFKQLISSEAFYPFADAAEALETLMGVASGIVPPSMQKFLELHMPEAARSGGASRKKKHVSGEHADCALGVCDAALGKALSELGYKVIYSPSMLELHRGVRMHLRALAKPLRTLPLAKFQVGLGHSYSRELMQVDPRKQDKPIMQSVALIDSLDKTINSFSMKLKEWYGWHFPELIKIVTDTEAYCKAVLIIKQKEEFDEQENGQKLLEAVGNSEEVAAEVLTSIKHSMGQEISEEDFANIERFAQQLLRLCEQRKALQEYLSGKMDVVSPNLKAVVGEVLGARLISHAGALVSLAKYPASTIQILGAEKALFRALKARSGRTPKYGLLFHSSFIGRVQQQKHRGRMSRYLASKCALAARIDAFSEEAERPSGNVQRSHIFGDKLRDQLEERLRYLADGIVPRKNLDVMREAAAEESSQEDLSSSSAGYDFREARTEMNTLSAEARVEQVRAGAMSCATTHNVHRILFCLGSQASAVAAEDTRGVVGGGGTPILNGTGQLTNSR